MVKMQVLPQGTRVRVKKGAFPLDASLPDRTGLVIHLRRYGGTKYGVQLDGETGVRVFAEDELDPLAPAIDHRAAGMKVAHRGSGTPA